MAGLNTARLVMQATDIGWRANNVRRDPAVVKAASVAGADIAQAANSTYALVREISGAWRRATPPRSENGRAFAPA